MRCALLRKLQRCTGASYYRWICQSWRGHVFSINWSLSCVIMPRQTKQILLFNWDKDNFLFQLWSIALCDRDSITAPTKIFSFFQTKNICTTKNMYQSIPCVTTRGLICSLAYHVASQNVDSILTKKFKSCHLASANPERARAQYFFACIITPLFWEYVRIKIIFAICLSYKLFSFITGHRKEIFCAPLIHSSVFFGKSKISNDNEVWVIYDQFPGCYKKVMNLFLNAKSS